MKLHLPRIVRELGKEFENAGYEAYLVGGAVRNLLRKERPSDFDIATNALPEQVSAIFRRVIPTGIKHGTVTVFFREHQFETTTFRTENAYSDLRRPDSVHFVPTIEEDLKRRDFTINSMAVHAVNGTITDPHNGQDDLKSGIIRAVGDPFERFSEDGLRLLRACRFACQLNFSIEASTLSAMRAQKDTIRSISAERVRDELNKILASDQPSLGFLTMESAGLLEIILPELSLGRGVTQKGTHIFDVLDHSLYTADGAPKKFLHLRLAALFHDIGKPSAKKQLEDGTVVFHNHDLISAKISSQILTRLKYPKAVEKKVAHLIKNHMFFYEDDWSDAAVRRFLRRIGIENVEDLFALRIADGFGMKRKIPSGLSIKQLHTRIDSVLQEQSVLSIRDLAVGGNDLVQDAGIPKGPIMGIVLDYLLETVIDDPSQNSREHLLRIAREFHSTYITRD
ncbi:MAG: HD domain-containing protein [Spirochaetales bacterium]|nr:HD domain-containing protein [Spirochaetales bacterium]